MNVYCLVKLLKLTTSADPRTLFTKLM